MTNRVLIGLCICLMVAFGWMLWDGCNNPRNQDAAQVKEKIARFVEKANRVDTVYALRIDTVYRERATKKVLRNAQIVEIQKQVDPANTLNDTIKQLWGIIQLDSTLLSLDSIEIGLWTDRHLNQKELADSLKQQIPALEQIYRKELKVAKNENKRLRVTNTVLLISGLVMAVSVMLR